jgi:TolB-like protein/DNA-binding winged helix-turn-helix (wHTH) protein
VDDVVSSNSVAFGPWRYDRHLGRLSREDGEGGQAPVAIGSRAGQILAVLLRDPGALVSKDTLMDAVWPGVTVEANNLTVQIASLRRIIDTDVTGQSRIQTIPGRGYRFVGAVERTDTPAPKPELPPAEPDAIPAFTPAPNPTRVRRWRIDAGVLAGSPMRAIYAAVILLICVVGGASAWMLKRVSLPEGLSPGRQQIAVLPLLTIGGGDEYFAEGLTEDLIAALGRFPEIAVRARSAVIAYKDHPGSPAEIAQTLAVRYIVEGSVRRAPDRLRIAVRLIGTDHGAVLWSETYDAEPKDVFAVQDDITRRVAGALSLRLDTLAVASAVAKPPDLLEAYDLVLRGRQRLDLLTRVGTNEARALFEQAIALDPNYAAAYVGLGRVGIQALEEGWTGDAKGTLARALANGQKAVALQDDNPAAHAVLGRALGAAGDIDVGVNELKRAVALNPSDPESLASYGCLLSLAGDAKSAIPFYEEAARFRPNRPASEYLALGITYLVAGRPADAARTAEEGVTRAGQLVWFSVMLAMSYAQLDRPATRHGRWRTCIGSFRNSTRRCLVTFCAAPRIAN